jgi:hypothetical protein
MSVILELSRPHAGQQQIIDTARRFNVAVCGRRFGKTVLGQDRLINTALLKGLPAAWFAPTYKLASDAWRELQKTLQPLVADVSQQDKRLELKGGGVLEVWSLDSPDAGRGRGYGAVVIDEAALIANLEDAWQSIRPMLSDHQGSAWFLSTPKGTANYFHTLYQRGQDASIADWKSWQLPSSANPNLAPAEIEAARQDLSDLAFSQEYMGMFVTWAGAVFRKIQDAVTLSPTGKAAIIGVDWGRTSDYTALLVLSDSGCVLEIDRFRGIEYSLQRARLKALWERHGKPTIIAERNAMGQPVIEQLAADGLPVRPFLTTNESKSQAVEGLALAFERGKIQIPGDAALLGELAGFEAQPLPSGLMRYSAPAGAHDDIVMALAIAWQGLGKAVRRVSDLAGVASILEANAQLERPSQWDMGPSFSEAGTRWTH